MGSRRQLSKLYVNVFLLLFFEFIDQASSDDGSAVNNTNACANLNGTDALYVAPGNFFISATPGSTISVRCDIGGYTSGTKAWWERKGSDSDTYFVVTSTFQDGQLSKNLNFIADKNVYKGALSCNASSRTYSFNISIYLQKQTHFGMYRCGVMPPIGAPRLYSGVWQITPMPNFDVCSSVRNARYAILYCSTTNYFPEKGHYVTWYFRKGTQDVVLRPGQEMFGRVFADYSQVYSLYLREFVRKESTVYEVRIHYANNDIAARREFDHNFAVSR